MMNKKITFIPHWNNVDYVNYPVPATKCIPEWYKKTNLFMYNQKEYGLIEGVPNTTIKACSPFLDGFTFGYIYTLPADLLIKKFLDLNQEYKCSFEWRNIKNNIFEFNLVSHHSKEQHPLLPKSQSGMEEVHKWVFPYIINTPKGYSTFFTHPINRHDLPFRTFSGIVETDEYTQAVQFPFQLLNFEEDQIIIEKGTPICQIIPFKRDNWNSETKKYSNEKLIKESFEFNSKIIRSYKNKFWKTKAFK